ncbi:MAG: hypothetical protein ABL901_10540 [Hyphomicrobiaceae bacterium]
MTADVTTTVRHYRSIWRAARLGTLYAIGNNAGLTAIMLANAGGDKVMNDLPAANMPPSAMAGFAISSATLIYAFTRAGTYRKASSAIALIFASLVVSAAAYLIIRAVAGSIAFDFYNVLAQQFIAWHLIAIASVLGGLWSYTALSYQNATKTPFPGFAVAKSFSVCVAARRQSYSELNTTKYAVVPLALLTLLGLYWFSLTTIYAWNDQLFPVLSGGNISTSEDFAAIFKNRPTEAFLYNAIGIVAIFSIFPIGLFVSRIARRIMQRHADALILSGRYAPIVFLRSFQDENVRVAPISYVRWVTRLFPRLEEVVLQTVAKMGPPIAIGLPGEKMRRLGAMRAYYDNHAWQPAFKDWVARAHLIVAMAGTTPWALWELRYIIEHGHAGKLILVFPATTNECSRWEKIATAIDGTPWHAAWTATEPANVRTLAFGPGGKLQAITSAGSTQADYEFAVRATVVAQSAAPAHTHASRPQETARPVSSTTGPFQAGVAIIRP